MAFRFKIPWQKWTYFDINPINSVAISFLRYFMVVVIDLINVPCKTESIGMRYCCRNYHKWSHSLRSMAVLSSRAQERRSREIRARSARERAAKPREKFQVASAPISSRFLCPRPPLLLSAPNQNRHATQANGVTAAALCRIPTKKEM